MSDQEQVPAKVRVRRQWNDYRVALYHVTDVSGFHWSDLSGGVCNRSPYPMLCGYVTCDAMLDGELAHSGSHGPCPHRVKVCITQVDNDRSTYRRLAAAAGPKPSRRRLELVRGGKEGRDN
jgi:hypothetical protein